MGEDGQVGPNQKGFGTLGGVERCRKAGEASSEVAPHESHAGSLGNNDGERPCCGQLLVCVSLPA